jgi:hypothetical protein
MGGVGSGVRGHKSKESEKYVEDPCLWCGCLLKGKMLDGTPHVVCINPKCPLTRYGVSVEEYKNTWSVQRINSLAAIIRGLNGKIKSAHTNERGIR